jgi:ion channel-forming bestrophin family protein
MIVPRRIDPFRTLRLLLPILLMLLGYDLVVTVLYVEFHQNWVAADGVPLSLLGTPIALVVTLRNNAAYGRWWEARTLWGAVVNNSRSVARGAGVLIDDAATRTRLVRWQIAYVLALRSHLLKQPPWEALDRYVDADEREALEPHANVPAAIQMRMAGLLAQARRQGSLSEIGAGTLDRTLTDLANAQGGLERIKNTPLPRQYNHAPKVFTRLLCLLLPIGLVHDLGWATPIASTVVGCMFLVLDQIGRSLEDPFENTEYDVPMRAITRTIEIDLLQCSGERDVPKPVTPVDGVLW